MDCSGWTNVCLLETHLFRMYGVYVNSFQGYLSANIKIELQNVFKNNDHFFPIYYTLLCTLKTFLVSRVILISRVRIFPRSGHALPASPRDTTNPDTIYLLAPDFLSTWYDLDPKPTGYNHLLSSVGRRCYLPVCSWCCFVASHSLKKGFVWLWGAYRVLF